MLQRSLHGGVEVPAAGLALSSAGARGEAGRLQRKPRRAVGSIRATRGSQSDAERGWGRPSTAGGAAQRRRQESRGRSWRWKKKGYFAISEISRDQTVK